jgi:hypothetical protein
MPALKLDLSTWISSSRLTNALSSGLRARVLLCLVTSQQALPFFQRQCYLLALGVESKSLQKVENNENANITMLTRITLGQMGTGMGHENDLKMTSPPRSSSLLVSFFVWMIPALDTCHGGEVSFYSLRAPHMELSFCIYDCMQTSAFLGIRGLRF